MGILDGYEELEDDNEPEQKTIERTASAPLILDGDCLQLLPGLDANSVDVVVTDPTYGLAFMVKDWDKFGLGKYQHWTQQWARECLRVLKPGGHLLAFGGTRTSHRLAAGIEDAGFELRDTVQWLYGSGFPKSRDVSKSIDKEAGEPRSSLHTSQSSLHASRSRVPWPRTYWNGERARSTSTDAGLGPTK